jgi:hypothetical protein
MVNSLDTYEAAGRKAGLATRRRDAALSQHWHRWAEAALRLERSTTEAEAARRAYERGFSDGHKGSV